MSTVLNRKTAYKPLGTKFQHHSFYIFKLIENLSIMICRFFLCLLF